MVEDRAEITHVGITSLGEAFVDWMDSRTPNTSKFAFPELDAFSAGWQAALREHGLASVIDPDEPS